ncbi:hypothetical protein BU24DRAFT_380357 [Aaosphaeria arxii CBS 175.79]|uniref:Zn(2)-C6 fungal-type domain-containing protein n=1 Tax=Aaosphaeria arxii CBS 175.79 TaxID=1450172 RepID=A0A6A5XA42_9PLEO|nr:uncharacterized protein BU24DRAFT_380357 [Aaosphaeria arxii CBS 175.79]KAF2009726.1 hypothetical protein BU24DRAFT_380357 [Aaosphaeria arxii CBS 175.79]
MPGAARGPQEKRAGRRKHSFGGCRTCRRRHVKCDQVRPSCLACRAVNAVCEGYSSDVRWMPPATLSSATSGQLECDDSSKNTTRHHLYSEATRKSMSKALVAKLGSHSVDESLAEIETKTKDAEGVNGGDVSVGPFGILNFECPVPHAHLAIPIAAPEHPRIDVSDMMQIDAPNDNTTPVSLEGIADQQRPIPTIIDWFDPVLGYDSSLHWADLLSLDFDTANSLLQPTTQNPLDFFSFDNLSQSTPLEPISEYPSLNTGQLGSPPPLEAGALHESQRPHTTVQVDRTVTKLEEVKSVEEAQFLLRHFNVHVISQMSFIPQQPKSPWKTMQLPEAMHTLADLSYLHSGTTNHANASNLYALLACATYHLQKNASIYSAEPESYWQHLFTRLKERAKRHLQISLRDESRGNSKAKYKEQLMAILSMLAVTSLTGRFKDARCYSIDAERLLRVRGLAKREISRRCRILHHVYSWIRIVGESTYVLHDYKSYSPIVDNMSAAYRAGGGRDITDIQRASASSRSGHNARLDDFLRLEPHSSDSDLDIEDTKEHEPALYDIHLEDSRQFSGTLYKIYGISETWLSLVSQTTRLANIIDAASYSKETDIKFQDFLQKRATRLEHIICSFALKDPPSEDEDDEVVQQPNHYMLRALNSALVILFYRRVRNVNPLILQGHVDSVVQSLRDFDAGMASQGILGPGSPWPAFIAGCEALSRRNRKFLRQWVEKGAQKCGFEYFNMAQQIMQEVWDRQDEPPMATDPGSGGSLRTEASVTRHHTWVDVSKEKSIWVTLF